MKKTVTEEDYAVARSSYPWWVLALAYVATTASGSTFMGIPGMAYKMGFKALYYPMIYPIGIYLGSTLLARRTKKMGDRLGSLSIPDYLGDYYQSNLIRVMAAVLGIFLIYYIMAQLVAAGQMFTVVLGLEYKYAIWFAGGLVALYMAMGGSHSDILTDAVQGFLMLLIVILIIVLFFTGYPVGGGGASAVNAALPDNMQWTVHTDPNNPIFYAWWTIFLLFIAHIPFTCLPHLGNKFFALRGTGATKQFNVAASILGLIMGAMVFAGLLGKAMGLGDIPPDQVVPQLFTKLMPPWLGGLLSIAILSAIVSTTDGLFMAVSQLFANDLYRKTYVPLAGKDPNSPEVNRNALLIGRIGVVVVGVVAILMVRKPPALLSILLWVGIGGIVSAFAGPMFLAAFWHRATRAGAIWGMIVSFAFYFWIHLGPKLGLYEGIFPWNKNPFAAAGVGAIISVAVTYIVSLFTEPLPEEHVRKLWAPPSAGEKAGSTVVGDRTTVHA
ncbi:sodium:solute symporter family protein [Calderihabitans maritimus]|nr:sodium:solute symporter family protein [Calderihabitans maritimus]